MAQQEYNTWAIKNTKANTYLRQGNGKIITFPDKPTAREYLKLIDLDSDIYEVIEYKMV